MLIPIILVILSSLFYIFYIQTLIFVFKIKDVLRSNEEKDIYNLSDVLDARIISFKLLTANYILLLACFVVNVALPTSPTSIGMLLFSNIIFYIAIIINMRSLKYIKELYTHIKSNNIQDILYTEYFWQKTYKSEEEIDGYKKLAEIINEIEYLYSEIYTEEVFHNDVREKRVELCMEIINIKRLLIDGKNNLRQLIPSEEFQKELNLIYTDIKQLNSKYSALQAIKPFKLILSDLQNLLNKSQKY